MQNKFRFLTVWIVTFGKTPLKQIYYTEYHAEQFARALQLNGTPCSIAVDKVLA